jgi:hypothetical protein
MMNALKKFLTVWFSPYTIFFTDRFGRSEVHYAWTLADALEWAACSLRDEDVCIYKYHNPVAARSITEEI